MKFHGSDDGRFLRRRSDGLRMASATGMAIAAALMCMAPATSGSQDEIRIKNISSLDSSSMPAEAPGFLVRTARVPIFVNIDLGGGGAPRLPETAVDDVVAMLDANPRRLVVLRFKGGALCFDDLARGTRETLLEKRGRSVVEAYNEYLANQILTLTRAIDSERPGSPLAIQGIPFEGSESDVSKGNEAYRDVLDRMNAIVLGGGMMVSGASEESSMLLRAYPHAVELADGRAILFASNVGWRIATPIGQIDGSALAIDHSLDSGAHIPLESPILASAEGNDAIGEVAVFGSPSSGDIRPDGGASDTSSPGEGAGTERGVGNAGSPASQGGRGGGFAGGSGGGSASGGGSGGVAGSEEEGDAKSSDDDAGHSEGDDPGADGSDGGDGWDPDDEVVDVEGDVGDEERNSDDPGLGDSDDSSSDSEADGEGEDSGDSDDGNDEDSDGTQTSREPLVPGGGPVGSYPSLDPIGSFDDFGGSAPCIAAWDVVPHQDIDGVFELGVVAFHVAGIKEVRFSLDGGPWVAVREMTWNSRTGVYEFCAMVDSALHVSGDVVEIRAIAIPDQAGVPTPLDPMHLRISDAAPKIIWCASWGSDSEGDGSKESPFRQPQTALSRFQTSMGGASAIGACDGLHLYLEPGEYDLTAGIMPYPSTDRGWLTISGAPDVDPRDVRIVSGDGIRSARVKLERLTVHEMTLPSRVLPGGAKQSLWIDGVEMYGSGPFDGMQPLHSALFKEVFVTSTLISQYDDGPKGAKLLRSVNVIDLGADAFTLAKTVINCTAQGIRQAPEAHSDIYQLFCDSDDLPWDEAIIVYGMTAIDNQSQGIFFDDCSSFSNIAIVNCLLSKPSASSAADPPLSKLGGGVLRNILIDGLSLPNQTLRLTSSVAEDVLVRNSLFWKVSDTNGMLQQGNGYNNHFIDSVTYGANTFGTDYSTGPVELLGFSMGVSDAEYVPVYSTSNDFSPAIGSDLNERCDRRSSPVDLQNTPRGDLSSVGALEVR